MIAPIRQELYAEYSAYSWYVLFEYKLKIYMKKLLFILLAIVFVGCCEASSSTTDNTQQAEVKETVDVSSVRINVKGTTLYLYQFEYQGHQYITSSKCNVLWHLQSCLCHSTPSPLIVICRWVDQACLIS